MRSKCYVLHRFWAKLLTSASIWCQLAPFCLDLGPIAAFCIDSASDCCVLHRDCDKSDAFRIDLHSIIVARVDFPRPVKPGHTGLCVRLTLHLPPIPPYGTIFVHPLPPRSAQAQVERPADTADGGTQGHWHLQAAQVWPPRGSALSVSHRYVGTRGSAADIGARSRTSRAVRGRVDDL